MFTEVNCPEYGGRGFNHYPIYRLHAAVTEFTALHNAQFLSLGDSSLQFIGIGEVLGLAVLRRSGVFWKAG
jgi:hypothetical protein